MFLSTSFFGCGVGGGISPRLFYVYYFAVTSKLAVALADNILLNGAINALTNLKIYREKYVSKVS